MELIKRGAEAEIHLSEWQNRHVVLKSRVVKSYRHEEIDRRLREARTKLEAKLISEARGFGVSTPIIYDVDTLKSQIVMEYIDGKQIKEALHIVGDEEQKRLCTEIGRCVGKFHKNDLIHGDLTTSNMILMNDRIYFIDFSLGGKSKEVEAKGVDLHLLSEAFESTHSEILEMFDHVLEGYKIEYTEADKVIAKVKEIEKRGRYT
ncbi:MAG: Kae1-associated serine/threonine protein kinase [Thermoplasmata archaeon]|nr:MAG: Kae1-associated serine/threonine protein kinase [Thermoplasmata archaeon]